MNQPTSLLTKSTQQFLNLNLFGILKERLDDDGIYGKHTSDAIVDMLSHLRTMYQTAKYNWEAINLMGIRRGKEFTDKFTDWIIYFSSDNLVAVPASTKAGSYYVHNPITYGGVKGTAGLVDGYWKNLWVFKSSADWKSLWLGMPYMQQVNDCQVYRDGNLDNVFDENVPKQFGEFGINMHHAGIENFIYNWSAACQIIQKQYWTDVLKVVPFVAGRYYSYWLLEM